MQVCQMEGTDNLDLIWQILWCICNKKGQQGQPLSVTELNIYN